MDNQPTTSDYNFLDAMVFSPESCEREPLWANNNELSQPYVVSNEPEDSERTVRENFTLIPAREDDSNPM